MRHIVKHYIFLFKDRNSECFYRYQNSCCCIHRSCGFNPNVGVMSRQNAVLGLRHIGIDVDIVKGF